MWSQRRYEPGTDDEDGVVSLWLRSYSESEYGKSRGAHVERSESRTRFWEHQRHTTLALIDRFGVDIICDTEEPNVMFAFACHGPGIVHFAVVKKRYWPVHGAPMLRTLLASQLASMTEVVVTHEIRDLRHCRVITPQTWRADARALIPAIMGFYR